MTYPSLKAEHRQSLTLTPRLQQAVRLLQLSALDYELELHEMMNRNPFLELDEAAAARAAATETLSAPVEAQPDTDPYASDLAATEPDFDTEAHADTGFEQDSWVQSPGTMRDGAREPHASAIDMMAFETGLRRHLHDQAVLLPLSERDQALICSVIESLDDDGYLRTELAEVASLAELDVPADESEMTTALRLVQSFDPAGVGARSVGECMLLQLDKVEPAWREIGRQILDKHLDRLARRDIAGLAALLGKTPSEVESACQALRRLDPRPGWRFTTAHAQYVTPDVVVRKVRGKWVAQLNPAVKPKLRLNRSCADLFQRHREARHAELGAQLQEARWTLRNIEQRFSTILDVAQAILRRQHLFFEHGPLAMKPLALRDIAAEIGVHESTVCRVTNNKFMATPSGLFELKHFFSRPMPMSGGGACTATAIRSVVREMIDGEPPEHPLSDVAITQRLAREGLTVARRTVTKYRQAMKIEPAERRRVGMGADAASVAQPVAEGLRA